MAIVTMRKLKIKKDILVPNKYSPAASLQDRKLVENPLIKNLIKLIYILLIHVLLLSDVV